MIASNSRKLTSLVSLLTLSQTELSRLFTIIMLEQQIRTQNPEITNYTFLKYCFGSVEKIILESVYLRVFPLLGDILWWGNIRNHWKMFGTYWATCDRQAAAQIRDLDHWGKSWWLVYLTVMIGYVWICVSIHVFLHTCRPTPCSVGVVQQIMFPSLKATKATLADVAEIHHICSVPALCSARPKGCKANMDQKAAVTEKWSVKTTWFLPIEYAFFIHKYCLVKYLQGYESWWRMVFEQLFEST